MWLVIVPLVALLLILVSVTSLAAALIGLLGSHWPWLLIGLGAWLFWRDDGQHGRRHHRRRQRYQHDQQAHRARHGSAQRPTPLVPPADQAAPEPTPLRRARPAELPIDVQVKVEQIKRKADVLLGYADRFPPFSRDLYLVRQTTTEYLPRTLQAYLALPPQAVDRPLAPGGPTPRQELQQQLDLLDGKLDEIAQDLQRQDVDRLLANRRFLEERFGRASA
ncbi:MAG: hypothetical protein M3336_05450 [Chloroflexota bacterium]|nr:hypothetical protein [Chloroflexota bacterium]